MALMDIVKYPDPRLRQESKAVDDPAEVRDLVRDMAETMYANEGAGLAAIQVGVPLRLFMIDAPIAGGDQSDPPIVFINPEPLELGKEKQSGEEGCLSFPGIYLSIDRAQKARFRATNLDGEQFEVEGDGLFARALQHEFDHLNGKLIADFVGRIKKQLIRRKLRRSGD